MKAWLQDPVSVLSSWSRDVLTVTTMPSSSQSQPRVSVLTASFCGSHEVLEVVSLAAQVNHSDLAHLGKCSALSWAWAYGALLCKGQFSVPAMPPDEKPALLCFMRGRTG